MPVIKSPFEAQHGYKSPGFTVDELGNVTVRTLSYTVQEEVEISGDSFSINTDYKNRRTYPSQSPLIEA